jgi:hypothetical protein
MSEAAERRRADVFQAKVHDAVVACFEPAAGGVAVDPDDAFAERAAAEEEIQLDFYHLDGRPCSAVPLDDRRLERHRPQFRHNQRPFARLGL